MILDMLPPWARDAVVFALSVLALALKLGLVKSDSLNRLLVGVIEDRDDPLVKALAKKKAEEAGLQPALHKIVVEETEDLGGPLPPAPPSPGRNGAALALLLALALAGSGCVAREVHETAVRAKATATTVREKASKFRRIVVPASTEGRAVAATLALGDELEAALADLETAIGKVEEASR